MEDLRISDLELIEADDSLEIGSVKDYEEKLFREAMKKCDGNLTAVAKVLKISRQTLYNRMKKYGS